MSIYIKRKKKHITVSYRWVPFVGISTYVLLTLALCLWGPWEYPGFNKLLVSTYIICFLFITWIGMLIGSAYKPKQLNNNENVNRLVVKYTRRLIYIVFVIKSLLILSCIKKYGSIEIGNLMESMAMSYTRMNAGELADSNFFRQMDTFMTFLYISTTVIGFFIWEKLKFKSRLILIINILLTIIYNIFYLGIQKIIGDTIIYFCSIFIVKGIIKNKEKFKIKTIVTLFIVVMIAFFMFSFIIAGRKEYWGSSFKTVGSNGATLNLNHPLLLIIPESLRLQVGSFLVYPTMGYYGLSLCLQLPFKWTYGLGSALGIKSMLDQIIPGIPNVMNDTYLIRMQNYYGIDAFGDWHTIFPWLASDMTFIGALVYMGIIGYIYMRCWKQVVLYKNPISIVLLTLLNIQYVYIVTNNQLFHTRGDAMATIVIFLLWLIFNNRLNFKDDD
ncbi:hypothetical protein [Paraclostridium dentum]|uniref:hypothetical protein n=1 Tax=Paraclostridium dentum TaxID=2662455 RepID=UPI0014734588|nr:hypothetical protein [Paraclostridium dentum]